jgi:ssDNA-binding Zn-finger/Zn-ribbon topoisomerase 1
MEKSLSNMKNLFVDDNTFYEFPDQNIIKKIQKFLSNYNLKNENELKRLKQDMSKLSKLDNMYIYMYIMDYYYKCSYDLKGKKTILQNKILETFLADCDKDLKSFIKLSDNEDKVEQLSVECNINFDCNMTDCSFY